MGAHLSLMAPTAPSIALSAYVDVLDQIQYLEQLGTSRFLKTVKANDPDGSIVTKVFIKPNEGIELSKWKKILDKQKDDLVDIPSVLPYLKIIETDRAGYLIRQFIKSNIYDRISTRPFLEKIEKKWIIFQLLNAVNDCHERDVTHGDIKTENILVTSWNWILLTDFAPFKPVYLPEDNPGSFSFFFDTSQRRTCYLAPERFLNNDDYDVELNEGAIITKEMDVFSLGCAIAEIYLEGVPIFTLSQLYKYKRGEFEPDLNVIDDPHIRELVKSMISLDPKDRSSTKEYLDQYKSVAFPENFYTFIYEYFKSFNEDIVPFHSTGRVYECDSRIKRLYNDFDKISYFLGYKYEATKDDELDADERIRNGSLKPIRLSLPGIQKNYSLKSTSKVLGGPDDAALIFLSFIVTASRNVRQESSKIQALELILALAERVHDEAKLDRVLPYVILFFNDSSINVQATALKTLTQLLVLVDAIGPVNVLLFSEYIIPRLSALLSNASTYVRIVFAACLPYLSQTSLRFHDMATILKTTVLETSIDPETENNGISPVGMFDISKESLRADFETFAISMLTDTEPNVKIALLKNILPLCSFFGKEKTNDLILSHLITYLNDKSSFLRISFVEAVVGLSIYVGSASLEHYILPLLVQTLTDPEELVVIRVLQIFRDLNKLGLISKDYIWDLLSSVSKLLLHPNEWIKQSALMLIISTAEHVSLADLYCVLYPIIRPYFEYDVTSFTWDGLYSVCKRSISRSVYNLACTWSLRAENSLFWQQVKSPHTDAFGNRGLDFLSKPLGGLSASKQNGVNSIISSHNEVPLSSEDKSWIDRLISSGLHEKELWKVADMREYIYRVSRMSIRNAGKEYEEQNGVETQKFGVLPKNVFFDSKLQSDVLLPRTSHESSRSPFGSIDDRLNVDALTQNGSNSENFDEVTLTPAELNRSQSIEVNDASGTSLVLKNSKAAPSIITNEENAFGELESSFHQRKQSLKPRDSNDPKVVSTIITNSYTGNDPFVVRFLNSIKIEPTLEEFTEFDSPVQQINLAATKSWTPKGDLISHTREHKSSITSIDASPDHSYFITGDNEGHLKLWETARLEKNVSQVSTLTVDYESPITKIVFLNNYNVFAVAAKNGSIKILKVLFKKNKRNHIVPDTLTILRELYLDGDDYAVDLQFGTRNQKHILYCVTSSSEFISIDIKNMEIILKLDENPSYGNITCFTIAKDDSWLLIGTSLGILSLWDLRFQLHLKSWKFRAGFAIKQLSTCSDNYHLNRKKGRYATVIGGTGDLDVTIWDVSTGTCREVFTRSTEGNSLDKFNLDEIHNLKTNSDDITSKLSDLSINKIEADRSLTALQLVERQVENRKKFWVLAASPNSDMIMWNVLQPEDSKILNRSINQENKPTFSSSQINPNLRIITERYPTEPENTRDKRLDKKLKRTKQSLLTDAQQDLIKRHHDIINGFIVLSRPYNMIVSVDRSGTMNVYK
ncbi:phosphoinositide-3-kinase, regulatory subunit [Wickerhamomyces ciferrii]|uniref:non-specific serine/threonine protein kinase n=1 Tax=Wickerhamomyces ciferrii (strain ATCC 14091 / BCRC 22168 / CBS 111 / JCM 3599 / NBRC 0793 / NRRL Y-1031 F-60-10) TaxID=1206466 RepID=K0KG29_WICCF|nr:phosphoinositide-3-kinase, regulatory subunit [Wickerhamomyces ciferrii]CCH44110.1 phosphoinositide-3-kinase, regulatory subunit [Wickerhamomyces ciferrii]